MSRVRGRPGPLRTQGLGNGVSGTGEWGWERESEPGSGPELRALSAEASAGAGEIKASGGETVRNRKERMGKESRCEGRAGAGGTGLSTHRARGNRLRGPGSSCRGAGERQLWNGQRSGINNPGSRAVAVVAAGEEQKLQP